MIGTKVGRWSVVAVSDEKLYRNSGAFFCRCECGTERLVAAYRLRSKKTMSCGCAAIEAAARTNTRHGLAKHPLQQVWRTMKERCYNPNSANFYRYGGRGIFVCKRWHKLPAFIEDNEALAKPGTTLDRIDNNGPYSPRNCRWVSPQDQANNRGNNLILEFRGRKQTCAQWARELKMFEPTLRKRIIDSGWSVEDALTTPVRRRKGSPHKPVMMR